MDEVREWSYGAVFAAALVGFAVGLAVGPLFFLLVVAR